MKVVLLVLIGIFATLSIGCPPTVEMVLFNHADIELTVISNGESYLLPKGSVGRFLYRVDTLGFKIRNETTEWTFDFPVLPREYTQSARWSGYEITCQIEPNGAIYILRPGVVPPLKDLMQQPEGFPVRPRK